MRIAIVLALSTAATACYTSAPLRRERTALAPTARDQLAAAFEPSWLVRRRQETFEQHYRAALAFYEKKAYPEAVAEFELAYAADQQPVVLFNIGQAYRRAGRPALALEHYKRYLDADPAAERNKVEQLIEEVERAAASGGALLNAGGR